MKKILILAGLLGTASLGQAQDDYVITNAKDTLYGTVKGATPAQQSVKVTFVRDGKTVVYKPNDIQEWGNTKSQYIFEAKGYERKGELAPLGVFMRRYTAKDAPVRYYTYYNTDGEQGYFQHFLQKNENMIEVPTNKKFYEFMAEYFKDYPELSQQILNKEFKKSQIEKIVAKYNTWKLNIR
jgi:hypothetical protein